MEQEVMYVSLCDFCDVDILKHLLRFKGEIRLIFSLHEKYSVYKEARKILRTFSFKNIKLEINCQDFLFNSISFKIIKDAIKILTINDILIKYDPNDNKSLNKVYNITFEDGFYDEKTTYEQYSENKRYLFIRNSKNI